MIESFVYSTFNKTQTEELVHSENLRESLRKVMKFSSDDEKDEILLDFYENFITFCISHDFSLEKTSCSFAILVHLVQTSISKLIPVASCEETLKNLLAKHSIQRPPYSVKVFTQSDIDSIQNFIQNTYFKHYSLYSYGFTPHKDMIITTEKLECAKFPPTLILSESVEISPETILELVSYLPRTLTPKEVKQDIKAKETESFQELEMDPAQSLLNSEFKAMKALMEEKFKKQDDEIFAKIELLKK